VSEARAAAEQPTADSHAGSIVLLMPSGGDAAVTQRILGQAGFVSFAAADMPSATSALTDNVTTLVVAEEALSPAARALLLERLADQPAWSDVPVIVLAGRRAPGDTLSPQLEKLTTHANLTILERPVRVATLVTTLRAAERARRRQFEVRQYLAERDAAEETLRESERRLLLAREQADAANRAKTDFLTTMSHELRTPLNAISGYVELLDMQVAGPVSEKQRNYLSRIQSSQRHLLSLLEEVLGFARLETGRLALSPQPVIVYDAIVALENVLQLEMQKKRLTFDCRVPDLGLVVLADPEKLRQILLNLVANGVKFTPEGGRITVGAAREVDRIRVWVTDTGIGIPSDQLENVFEPFFQVDHGPTRKYSGMGLGLAIARNLARAMNGEVSMESTPGVGSTAWLTLPAA